MCLSQREIPELPEDSTRIFKRNMADHYIDAADSVFGHGKFSTLNSLCFAEFLKYYYVVSNQRRIWDCCNIQDGALCDNS